MRDKYKHKKYLICGFLLMVTMMFAAACGSPFSQEPVPETNDSFVLSEKYTHADYNMSLGYPSGWEIASEKVRHDVLTVRLVDSADKSSVIVTVMPQAMNFDELISEARNLLENSLYNPILEEETEEKVLSDQSFTFLEARAGEKERLVSRSAVLSEKEESYIFILLSREDDYSKNEKVFHEILGSLKAK